MHTNWEHYIELSAAYILVPAGESIGVAVYRGAVQSKGGEGKADAW